MTTMPLFFFVLELLVCKCVCVKRDLKMFWHHLQRLALYRELGLCWLTKARTTSPRQRIFTTGWKWVASNRTGRACDAWIYKSKHILEKWCSGQHGGSGLSPGWYLHMYHLQDTRRMPTLITPRLTNFFVCNSQAAHKEHPRWVYHSLEQH